MNDPLVQRLRRDARSFDTPADLDVVVAVVGRRRRRRRLGRLVSVALLVTATGAVAVAIASDVEPVGVEAAAPDVDAFFRAVRAGDVEAIATYHGLDGDIDATDDNGLTGVLLASVRDDAETLGVLLDLGADPELRNDQGENALHVAARFGFAEVAEVLLAAGADPDAVAGSRGARTPLHLAVERGEVGVTRALLDGGADPDARTEAGAPVLESAFGGAPDVIVPLLLAAGADPTVETPWGPLADIARERGLDDVAAILDAAVAGP